MRGLYLLRIWTLLVLMLFGFAAACGPEAGSEPGDDKPKVDEALPGGEDLVGDDNPLGEVPRFTVSGPEPLHDYEQDHDKDKENDKDKECPPPKECPPCECPPCECPPCPKLEFDCDMLWKLCEKGFKLACKAWYHFCDDDEKVIGDDGCTPGYWRNPAIRNEVWTDDDEYGPGTLVRSVFECVEAAWDEDDTTLLDALGGGGGPSIIGAETILLRAATAALLNAQHPDVEYPLTVEEVIDRVDAVTCVEEKVRSDILDLAEDLDGYNNLGCPIDAFGEPKY